MQIGTFGEFPADFRILKMMKLVGFFPVGSGNSTRYIEGAWILRTLSCQD